MIDDLLQIIAPHHCCGCDKTGTLLCDNCKYNIIDEPFTACLACGDSLAGISGICRSCRAPYTRAWCVGRRQEYLQRLIDTYKFTHAQAAYRPLTDLLDERLPVLPRNTVIVPIPTVASHVRQRGYDHMVLIARYLAKRRGLHAKHLLERATNTKQRDANARTRAAQAKSAFTCRQPLDSNTPYLIIDDVVTTGATVKYAAKTLRRAGARTVWVASMSYQALD